MPYGSFVYGEKLYGPAATDAELRWLIQVDWDGDGVLDAANEALYAVDLSVTRGRDFFIRLSGGDAVGFEHIKPGRATIVLSNDTDRYSPLNTTGPLYPNILPGRYIKIQAVHNNIYYPVFAGTIEDIQSLADKKQVRISCVDGMQWLSDRDADVAIQTSTGPDEAADLTLDAAGWPTIWGRDVQSTSEVLPYWWTSNKRALQELHDLADSVVGLFYCRADGAAKFVTLNYAGKGAATITQSDVLREIYLPQPWEVVRNYIKVVARPRVLQNNIELWRLGEIALVPTGSSITRWATYTYNNEQVPATSVTAPVATTDYTANSAADGSGTDYTANIGIVRTNINGTTSKFVISNAGPDAYLTLFKLRGDAVTVPNSFSIIEEDLSSQAVFGKKRLVLDSNWLQDGNKASAVASWLIDYLPGAFYFPVVTLEARPDIQFSPDLLDTINFESSALHIPAQDYRVGYVEHRWLNENGTACQTTWKLESVPQIARNYWTFPTQLGTTSVLGL